MILISTADMSAPRLVIVIGPTSPFSPQFISGRRRKQCGGTRRSTRAAPIAGSMVQRPTKAPGRTSRNSITPSVASCAQSSRGRVVARSSSRAAPISRSAVIARPYGIARLQAAHRFPGALAGLVGQPESDGFVPNVVEIGKHACAPGIEPNDMPAILGLKHFPLSQRQRQKRIAEAFAKGGGQACDRTSENGARLLLEILGFVLPLDFRELTPRRHLVGRRSQVKSDTLLFVEPPVIVRK